jgi:hypothetical protein
MSADLRKRKGGADDIVGAEPAAKGEAYEKVCDVCTISSLGVVL